MKLTDKCKEAFEEWYIESFNEYGSGDMPSLNGIPYECRGFYNYAHAMQYGVFYQFFRSVNITITIEKDFVHTGSEVYYYNVFPSNFLNNFEMTLTEAMSVAIDEANNSFNKDLKEND